MQTSSASHYSKFSPQKGCHTCMFGKLFRSTSEQLEVYSKVKIYHTLCKTLACWTSERCEVIYLRYHCNLFPILSKRNCTECHHRTQSSTADRPPPGEAMWKLTPSDKIARLAFSSPVGRAHSKIFRPSWSMKTISTSPKMSTVVVLWQQVSD